MSTDTTPTTKMRPELDAASLPERMKRLPLDKRGYPIPAFVEIVNGEPDFRIMSQKHWARCVKEKVCWVCGKPLGRYMVFVAGAMCGINRTSSEPPSHRECAIWSAQNCPFLGRPHMVRREDDMTREAVKNVAGIMISRNPGVAMIWITRSYEIWRAPNGPLIEMGAPEEVLWFAEGRPATRAEVEESIRTGLPLLHAEAVKQKGGVEELARRRDEFDRLLPAVLKGEDR